MIDGETVTIVTPQTTVNEYGEEQTSGSRSETVVGAIIGPATTADSSDPQRPEGVSVDANMYVPRSFAWHQLRGCQVKTADNSVYEVVGDPRPVVGSLSPTGYLPVTIPLHREEG